MIFKFLANNLAIMLAMGLLYGLLIRKKPLRYIHYWQIAYGFIFGFAAIVTMQNSYVLRPGAIFDCRSVILSITGMFAGPLASLVSVLIASAYRLWQGGIGTFSGVLVIVFTAGIGVAFYYLRQSKPYLNKPLWLYAFGVLVHGVMLLLMLTFPWDIAIQVLKAISLPVIVLYPVGTTLLGKIFADQESRLATEQQLRAANQQVRASEAELESLSKFPSESPYPVLRILNNGTIMYHNQPSRPLLEAWQCEQGKILPEPRFEIIKQTIGNKKPVQSEVVCGDNVFLLTFTPIPGSGYVNIYAMDITDLKRAEHVLQANEQQLRAANQQLEANEKQLNALMRTLKSKNKELHDIVYVSSHDLKSPLVNINGFSGFLKDHCRRLQKLFDDEAIPETIRDAAAILLQQDIPEDLRFITQSAEKMGTLINGLLKISRIGTHTITKTKINLNEMMNTIIKTAAFKIQELEAIVTVGDLPDCFGDANQIDQVFSNLIDNALKYSDPSRKPRIHISGQYQDTHTVYCVQDNGIGIAPEHHQKVFEVFHRLTPSDTAGGCGLGLTVIRRIMDIHDGQVGLESALGAGSKFFISLPNQ